MSIGSIASLPPVIATQQAQAPVQQKPAAQAAAQTVATDSDGDNDGSGGANITPPVNIKA